MPRPPRPEFLRLTVDLIDWPSIRTNHPDAHASSAAFDRFIADWQLQAKAPVLVELGTVLRDLHEASRPDAGDEDKVEIVDAFEGPDLDTVVATLNEHGLTASKEIDALVEAGEAAEKLLSDLCNAAGGVPKEELLQRVEALVKAEGSDPAEGDLVRVTLNLTAARAENEALTKRNDALSHALHAAREALADLPDRLAKIRALTNRLMPL